MGYDPDAPRPIQGYGWYYVDEAGDKVEFFNEHRCRHEAEVKTRLGFDMSMERLPVLFRHRKRRESSRLREKYRDQARDGDDDGTMPLFKSARSSVE
jgi:hypothetical protein